MKAVPPNRDAPGAIPVAALRAVLAWYLAWWGLPAAAPAWAQQPSGTCWVSGQATLDFGTVDPAAGASTVDSMEFGCTVTPTMPAEDVQVRICVFIGEDPAAPGYLPRHMRGDASGDLLAYEIFWDPAMIRPIVPPGTQTPPDSWTMTVPASAGGSPVFGRFPVYGRVRPGQQDVRADRYQSHPQNSQFRYYLSTTGSPPLACYLPDAHVAPLQFGGVYAQVAETCRIVAATDMDFGRVTTLSGGRTQTSRISLSCPQGVAWQVGLGDGANALGATRRMAGPDGSFIAYELYRDAAHTQRWGNTLNDDTASGTGQGSTTINLPVYGRIEEQPAPAGIFQDTVTVTLTF